MHKQTILIMGCGWQGTISAEHFIKQGYTVWASTTQESKLALLKTKKIQPFLLRFPAEETAVLPSAIENTVFDLVIISVPVRRNENPDTCLEKFKALRDCLQKISYKQVVYLSSIGVYLPKNGPITENSEVIQSSTIFQIETFLVKELPNLIILRLGGLFGYGRIPGRYFSQKYCSVGTEKANYVHGLDVARALLALSKRPIPAGYYNLVAPEHPIKKTVYEKMAVKYDFPAVRYTDVPCIQKEVSSEKLNQVLSFTFNLPNPLDF